eukprot:14763979-Ditylum_brightwellii.AAC.1
MEDLDNQLEIVTTAEAVEDYILAGSHLLSIIVMIDMIPQISILSKGQLKAIGILRVGSQWKDSTLPGKM